MTVCEKLTRIIRDRLPYNVLLIKLKMNWTVDRPEQEARMIAALNFEGGMKAALNQ